MANSYYEYAQRDQDLIALISYLLPSSSNEESQKGFFDLNSDIQETIEDIGLKVIGD